MKEIKQTNTEELKKLSTEAINPWKKIATQQVYKNPWISVREDQVIRPDGKEGIYGVVDPSIAVGVVALTADNQIILVGQYRYPLDEYSWEIVEGGSSKGEEPIDTAKRELKEEAGLAASSWDQLGPYFHLSNCYTSEIGYAFLAKDLEYVGAEPDETEVLITRKIPFQDCLNLVSDGFIKDTLSIIGIQRAGKYILLKSQT